MIGVIGKDRDGFDLTHIISQDNGITPYLLTDSDRPTTVKTRYIAESQQMLRADRETSQALSPALAAQVLERLKSALPEASIIILSDYSKGVLSPFMIRDIIALAKEHGRRVLVDPKSRDFGLYKGASILTPNRKELSNAAGKDIANAEEAEDAARKLIAAHDLDGILAKLGADGVCIVMKDEPAQHFQAKAREVFDVSGAGDTVIATLALALAGGMTAAEAAELANIAGSIVVGKVGTATVSRDELAQELLKDETRHIDSKVATAQQAESLMERWRLKGVKTGFTNGCFDLLHPGHIALLRQARAACDRLVIGLNSDASVKRLKGENRPVQSEAARATVLASLADVDCVVVFDEDTPLDLIKTLKPDVLIKGADYTVENVVGAAEVQGWGGQVVLAELVEGQSTTRTIAKLQGRKLV